MTTPPRIVITSYSIHYTKLYDNGNYSFAGLPEGSYYVDLDETTLPGGGTYLTQTGGSDLVITSYSIHYTKLYEVCPAASAIRRGWIPTVTACSSSTASRPCGRARCGSSCPGRPRITSYNVCYTKLLRVLMMMVGFGGHRLRGC